MYKKNIHFHVQKDSPRRKKSHLIVEFLNVLSFSKPARKKYSFALK